MENNEELMAENAVAEPQKKRTRISKKDASDHVYSVTGEKGENLDQPKKRRTRKTKAEKEAEEAAMQSANAVEPQDEKAVVDTEDEKPQKVAIAKKSAADTVNDKVETTEDTTVTAEDSSETTEPVVKRKRGRKTKEEIMAAAAAAAAALAMKSQDVQVEERGEGDESIVALPVTGEKESKTATQQELNFDEFGVQENAIDNVVPEETFAANDDDESEKSDLLKQLQNKVNATHNEGVWEGDPGDGTDFIIVNDIPVEDNSAIPYYDMFDNPQSQQLDDVDAISEEKEDNDSITFNFNDIVSAIGLLEIMPDGYGFLRSSDYNYLSSPDDVHLTVQQIRQYSLKTGDVVECKIRPPHTGEKYFTMSSIVKVNGRSPIDVRDRISFENLTPLFPEERFNLCGDPQTTNLSTRIVDLFSPIGKGQRSLIVAQPKTGKTMLMKDIANAIAANHPEAYIMMLLIDERPEEVTDMARTVNAEVIASTFDEPADRHVKIAGLVLEKAKRLVECGHDVVIFLDSITRLARAYNTVAPASGKVLTGGVDANALQKPKRFFGAARNIEGGGSLTIIATALTDTGSKMDEVIFEEFKGTGNSELQLDRQLANKRIFPAVNLIQSSTRRDDLLLDSFIAEKMGVLRVNIADMNAQEAMTTITNVMKRSRNHMEFLMGMNE
jgi:transcription termination factor Rho